MYAWGRSKVRRATPSRICAWAMAGLSATSLIGAASAEVSATAAADADSPPVVPADSAPFDPATDEGALTVLGLSLNGVELGGETIVTVRNGETLIRVDDITRLRVRHEGGKVVTIDGQAFMALSAVPGLTFRIDKPLQQLQLTVPVDSFLPTNISNARVFLPPSQAARTAFLDYDLTFQQVGGKTLGAAFLQMGASDDRGLISNTMTVGNAPNMHHTVRLDTSFVRDDPSGLTRLTVGDTITRGSSWSPLVRFGGIKYGTDFGLQPGFISFPTPTFDGRAALPSNVELYVNNVLNYQGQVNQGPFTLDRLPLVTGTGDVSVIVKDALGVEHRVTSSYYVSSALLRPGLSDYSLEAGSERHRYGIESFDYGRPFAAVTYRHGLTGRLTVETRAEAASDIQDIGAGAVVLLGRIAEVGGSVAVSRGAGRGGFALSHLRPADQPTLVAIAQLSVDYPRFRATGLRRSARPAAQAVAGNDRPQSERPRQYHRVDRLSSPGRWRAHADFVAQLQPHAWRFRLSQYVSATHRH